LRGEKYDDGAFGEARVLDAPGGTASCVAGDGTKVFSRDRALEDTTIEVGIVLRRRRCDDGASAKIETRTMGHPRTVPRTFARGERTRKTLVERLKSAPAAVTVALPAPAAAQASRLEGAP
jgi:hypothetical protein